MNLGRIYFITAVRSTVDWRLDYIGTLPLEVKCNANVHHWTPEKKSTKYSGFLNQMRCISIALGTYTYKTQLMLPARAARAVKAVASVFNIESVSILSAKGF